jgi:hypothetical protein
MMTVSDTLRAPPGEICRCYEVSAEVRDVWCEEYWSARRAEKWFEISAWVPEPVAWMARGLYGDEAEWGTDTELQMIQRLATDKQMKVVWRELLKKKRDQNSITYLHPGHPSSKFLRWIGSGEGVDARQAAAMAELFRSVALYAIEDLPALMSEPKPHEDGKIGLRLADQLRTFTARLNGRRTSSLARRILDGATACEELASQPWPCPKCGTEHPLWEDEPDTRHMREMTRSVASACKKLFGSEMYNTTATIVTVIMGRTITTPSVREWLPKPVR